MAIVNMFSIGGKPKLQTIKATPSMYTGETLTPSKGYNGIEKVELAAIPSELTKVYTISTSAVGAHPMFGVPGDTIYFTFPSETPTATDADGKIIETTSHDNDVYSFGMPQSDVTIS